MINHIEKSWRLRKYLASHGYNCAWEDDVYVCKNVQGDDSIISQLIIDYDPLPEAKTEAKERLRKHATELAFSIYPLFDPEFADVRGLYNLMTDLYTGGSPLPARLQQMKDLRDTFIAKRADINAVTDWQLVDAYDAIVGW